MKILMHKRIYQKIVSQNLSVRDTEALVKNYQESLKPIR
jgi:ParB family chromosome partitioning protein